MSELLDCTRWEVNKPIVGGGTLWSGSSFDRRSLTVRWDMNSVGGIRARWSTDPNPRYYPTLDALFVAFRMKVSNQ